MSATPTDLNSLNYNTQKSTNSFTQSEVGQWFNEAMAEFRRIELEQDEAIDVNFIFHDKKRGAFSQLMALAYYKISSTYSYSGEENPLVEKHKKMLTSPNSFFNKAELHYLTDPEEQTLHSTIVMGRGSVENSGLSAHHAGGLDAYAKTPKERFQLAFLHELGHLVFEARALIGQGVRGHEDYRQNYNFNSSYQNPKLGIILEKIIQDNAYYLSPENKDNFLAAASYHGVNEIEAKYMIGYQANYKVLVKEMFSDCFSAVMCARLPEFEGSSSNPNKAAYSLITQMEDGRNSVAIGAGVFKDFKFKVMNHPFDHSTSHALAHLKTLIYENNIDLKNLNMEEIKDLCQASVNYGLTRFIFEAQAIQPVYQKFLNIVEIEPETQDLFVSKNAQALNITDIFNYLSPSDKAQSLEKIENFNIISERMSRASQLMETSLEDITANLLPEPLNTPSMPHLAECVELAGELNNFYCSAELGQAIAAFSYATYLSTDIHNTEFKQKYHLDSEPASKKTLNAINNTGATVNENQNNEPLEIVDTGLRSKISQTRFHEREKTETNLDLFTDKAGHKSTSLRDKIKSVAQDKLDAVLYKAPVAQKYNR